jgi:uncharacterized Zn-binding protein involved in type VI secretion
MPNLPAARRGDKTGHAMLHGGGGGGRASSAHGVAIAEGRGGVQGAARGAHYGAALAEGRGGVRLEHLGDASHPAKTKSGEGDQDDPVHTGSPNVLIGGTEKRAARAGVDVAKCSIHRHRELKEGSVTVLINGKPAARASEKLKCSGGHVLVGCETVIIGGDSGSDGSGGGASASLAVTAALAGAALANRALDLLAAALLGLDGAPSEDDAACGTGDGAARGAQAGAAISDGSASGCEIGASLG